MDTTNEKYGASSVKIYQFYYKVLLNKFIVKNMIIHSAMVNQVHYCSDFRYESNGIFVLGMGFFFFRQISTF